MGLSYIWDLSFINFKFLGALISLYVLARLPWTYNSNNSWNSGGRGWYFTKFSVAGFSGMQKKKRAQSDLSFCENEGLKRSKINEKGVNWIENHREFFYKML